MAIVWSPVIWYWLPEYEALAVDDKLVREYVVVSWKMGPDGGEGGGGGGGDGGGEGGGGDGGGEGGGGDGGGGDGNGLA